MKKKQAAKPGLQKGFCSNPFALNHRAPLEKNKASEPVRYGADGKKKEPSISKKITVKARQHTVQDNRLVPQRTPFSGGSHTLPHMNKEPAPEVTVGYKHNEQAATNVVVNPQDPASPLYRPAEQEGLVNSAGVYMNVEVQPDVHLRMGGEFSSDAAPGPYSSQKESAQGASLGVRWEF